jgi:hypothetical protein
MGGFAAFHWLVVIAVLVVGGIWPAALILRRAGFSPWWAILYAIPLIGWVGIWVFALMPWPALSKAATVEHFD